MKHFHKISPERCTIEELKNLTTLLGSVCYLFRTNLSRSSRSFHLIIIIIHNVIKWQHVENTATLQDTEVCLL